MSRADVIKTIADLHYKLADAYLELAGESATAPVSAARPVAADSPPAAPASFDSAEFEAVPFDEYAEPAAEGSEAVCPKHRVPYTDGRYGPYCTRQTDDPAWAKVKPDGKMFCKITPKNAAEYMRIRAAA